MRINKLKYYLFVGLATLFSVLVAQQLSSVNTASKTSLSSNTITKLFLTSSKPSSATPFSELEFLLSAEDLNENENETDKNLSNSFVLSFSSFQISFLNNVPNHLHYPQQVNNSSFDVPLYVKNCVYLI